MNNSFRSSNPLPPSAPLHPDDSFTLKKQLHPTKKDLDNLNSFPDYYGANGSPPLDDDDVKPSAPPPDLFDILPGYEDLSYEPIDIPPPAVPSVSRQEDVEGTQSSSLLSESLVTESVARNAFLKYAEHHCCFKKNVGQNMVITHMEPSSAFHYTLETFTEKRQTNWKCEPYRGGVIDGPENGVAPSTWEIVAMPPKKFEANNVLKEVPHTASVKTCYRCGGTGRQKCKSCSGKGGRVCYACDGNGHSSSTFQGDYIHCYVCHGGGNQKCQQCKGEGLCYCGQCAGTGQIKCYIGVNIEWTCHTDDYISDACSLPDEQIKTVNGTIALVEELPLVWPLDSFPDLRVGMASAQLIQKHCSDFPTEKILLQSQTVKIIPVTTVHYQWKNKDRCFVVYGQENHVYASSYPSTCCCTII